MIVYEHKAKSDQVTQWGKVTCIRTSDSQLFVVVGICKSVLCFMSEMPDRLRFVSKCVYYTSDLITVFVYRRAWLSALKIDFWWNEYTFNLNVYNSACNIYF